MKLTRHSGFTLTELMIAVVVLIVVIMATAKIFGTASTVAGVSEATTSILQEAAAIENQIRRDIDRLGEDGFFAIHSVALRNDLNGPVLLNPALPNDAIIRADQLMFFTNGVQGAQSFRLNMGSNNQAQASASRVYYGHAYQMPNGEGYDAGATRAHDLDPNTSLTPWYDGSNGLVDTVYTTIDSGNTSFAYSSADQLDATQPEARKWLFVRQPVILVDDDRQAPGADNKTSYLDRLTTARSIFMRDPIIGFTPQPQVRDARVDGAATLLNEIRQIVTTYGNADYIEQQNMILSAMDYPRAERVAPSSHRIDQPMTNHVISSACSSFRVEWTWADGVGEIRDDNGNVVVDGVVINGAEQPWFGLCDAAHGVFPYGIDTTNLAMQPDGLTWWEHLPNPAQQTIDPSKIEQIDPPNWNDHCDAIGVPFRQYLAAFAYNKNNPIDPTTNLPWDPSSPVAYTPWPTAIRVTMILHDPNTRLAQGREFQFVITLPRRR
jgi:prepilin-type N-terminal cleavage/methylation domain-containing protein